MPIVTPTPAGADLATTPTVTPPPAPPLIASIAVDAVSSSVHAGTISTGILASDLTPVTNDHAARLDITAQAVNGVYAIVNGLSLSAGTGLTLLIDGGQALMQGVVEVTSQAKTMAVSVDNWVWLLPNGTISSGASGYVPSPAGLFLGVVTCDATEITAIDYTSVFYMHGGLPMRHSGDDFLPTDTPTAACVHLVKTLGGTFLWDGVRYTLLEDRVATVALTDAATIATNAALGSRFTVTLAGNRTLGAPTNPRDGQRCLWLLKQDATGSRTLTLNAAFRVPTGITVTLSTAATTVDVLEAVYSSFVSGWIVTNFLKGI